MTPCTRSELAGNVCPTTREAERHAAMARAGRLAAICLIGLALGPLCRKANAQSGEWTWMAGANTADAPAVYGTLGVAAPDNTPGYRNSSTTWTDSSGNFWLFGGLIPSGPGQAPTNEIWVFYPSLNEWAWMGGGGVNAPGVYGTLGLPAPTNIPGTRQYTVSWADSEGGLWLFGGYGYDAAGNFGDLNDLWEFNTSTAEWTWMGGSSTLVQLGDTGDFGRPGIYGTVGVPAAGNIPGGRYSAAAWTDHNGNFWLFGGDGWDSGSTPGILNDLWEFNPSTGEWAWISGSSTIEIFPNGNRGVAPVYGPLGVFAPGNVPGSTGGVVSWTDGNGNLWFDGITSVSSPGVGSMGVEQWAFNPTIQEWAWMGGGADCCLPSYGTLGIPAPGNQTGALFSGGQATWTDSQGNLWVFGGPTEPGGPSGTLNILLEFNPSTLEWVWMSGSDSLPYTGASVPGVYGTMGVPDPANVPGTRSGTMSWTDTSGNLWLYGGGGTAASIYETGSLNDVWRYQPPARTATPAFDPPAGTYNSVQSVTIADATPGATIYYTTDGTSPTPASAEYAGPITVGSTQTLQAIVTSSNLAISFVGVATYSINQAATPTFSPAPGTFTSGQMVTNSDATAGATIYYTTDGSTPTTASAEYTGPISVNSTETIQTLATANGFAPSNVASGTYTIMPFAATPTFSLPAGTYAPGLMVAISDASPGTTIYYAVGAAATVPTTASTVYTGPVAITSTEYLTAIAAGAGLTPSTVASAHYVIAAAAAPPTFSLPSGTYNPPISVGLSDATSGVAIYYTTNGSTPTAAQSAYIAPFSINTTTTVEAIAVSLDGTNAPSAVASATYTMNLPIVATPTIGPAAGTYTAPQSVTISDTTAGAAIYYTTSGITPSAASALYSGPIPVGTSQTIQAIATASGYTQSAVASATYTINLPPAATPTFSPPAGIYSGPQSITISDNSPAATIYYTVDGTVPTTSSQAYGGPIFFSTGTIRAMAIAPNDSPSTIASATYNIQPSPPVFSVPGGTYSSPQLVGLSDTTPGVTIYYTTNGMTPTTSSTPFTVPIQVNSTETINAVAGAPGYSSSTVATATYTINLAPAPTPMFSPAPGTYTSAQSVTISDAASGASIYYAINATPTTASTPYTGPITVSSSETIQAIATATNFSQSAVATSTYTINLPPPDFQVSVNPTSLTIVAGQSGQAVFTVTPQNGFNSQVSFSCSGLPAEAACSFSPPAFTPSGAAISTTLTVTTTAPSVAVRWHFAPLGPANFGLLCAGFTMMFVLALFRRRALIGPRLAGLLLTLALASALVSCGGGSVGGGNMSTGNPGTPPGTSSVTVSASTSGGSINHGVSLTVIVTP